MASPFPFFILLLAAAVPLTSPAQQQAPASANASDKLRDHEATYQQSLRRIEEPLLADYLAKLRLLAARSAPADLPAVQAEIAKVQALASSGNGGGIRRLLQPAEPAADSRQKKPMQFRGPGLTLEARDAAGFMPAIEHPDAVLVGEAQWKIPLLPAGAYDIVAVYTAPAAAGTAPLIAEARFAGQQVKRELPRTKGDEPSHFRIGRIVVDEDQAGQPLRIAVTTVGLPSVWLRQVILRKPRPSPSP